MQEKLKITDLISYKLENDDRMTEQVKVLQGILQEYISAGENILLLEDIKKRLIGTLAYVATLYSRSKRYKGSNHTYMEEERKSLKARILKRMIEEGMSFNKAEGLVYDDEEYKEVLAVLNHQKLLFTGYEEVFHIYQTLLQSIVQSISVLNKEKGNYNAE